MAGRCTAACSRRCGRLLEPHFTLHLVDLPGHGHSRDDQTPLSLAAVCRRAARKPAAGALAGLVARRTVRAAGRAAATRGGARPDLHCATPRFVRGEGDDWKYGVSRRDLPRLRRRPAQRLSRHARSLPRARGLRFRRRAPDDCATLRGDLFARGEPAAHVLADGLRLLETVDLRAQLPSLRMPSLWLAGRRDRLVDPRAMRMAAEMTPEARVRAGRACRACAVPDACRRSRGDHRFAIHGSSSPRRRESSDFARRDAALDSRLRGMTCQAMSASLFDPRQVRRAFSRAADSYDAAAALQHAVEAQLLESLDYLDRARAASRARPGLRPGPAAAAMQARWPRAQVIALDLALPMLRHAKVRARLAPPVRAAPARVCADARALPLADGSVDVLFSNLCLQWVEDLPAVFAGFRRVLQARRPAAVFDLRPGHAARAARRLRPSRADPRRTSARSPRSRSSAMR